MPGFIATGKELFGVPFFLSVLYTGVAVVAAL